MSKGRNEATTTFSFFFDAFLRVSLRLDILNFGYLTFCVKVVLHKKYIYYLHFTSSEILYAEFKHVCVIFLGNKTTNYLPHMNIASTNMSVTIVVFSPQFQLSLPQSISSHDRTSLHFVRFYKNQIFVLFENIKYTFIF